MSIFFYCIVSQNDNETKVYNLQESLLKYNIKLTILKIPKFR